MPPEFGTIAEFAAALRAGETTALETTERCLDRIARDDGAINAFITVLAAEARVQARQADQELAAGLDRGPLQGAPISIKDLFDLHGLPTTAASAVRRGHVADADAAAVARLREAGAVFVGKTNLHEFALGTTNEDSAYGPVRHPLDSTRSPGGSSGGSAASVLAGMALASLGSDTGGSIRIPAAACGLVGLKPALGEVSTNGAIPLSTTMDHVGPICRSVEDAAILFRALREGPAAARRAPVNGITLSGLRLGRLGGYFTDRLDQDVRSTFEAACARLRRSGAAFDAPDIPHAQDTPAVYTHVILPEAAAYHAAWLDSRPADYTVNVRLRLEMGRYIQAEDYVRARRGREVLIREVDAALTGVDALLLPAMAVPATPLGAETIPVGGADEPVRNITLRLTQLFNLTGHPAITLPCGTTPGGLPVGLQLVGRDTEHLLAVAAAVEAVARA